MIFKVCKCKKSKTQQYGMKLRCDILIFAGLPLALMSEESALLVEIGVCELHIAKNLNDAPGEEEKLNIESSEQKYKI